MVRPVRAVVLFVAMAGWTWAAAAPAAALPQDPEARDPTLLREGGWYYTVLTRDETEVVLPVLRSRDLRTWEPAGSAFGVPGWVGGEIADPSDSLWAPDLSFWDGRFRLYYSASSFGSTDSAIGVATATTLDPDAPGAGWTDEGLVVDSEADDPERANAIDPEIAFDAQGTPWLAYGSFFSGLYIRRLDRATGKPDPADPFPRRLAYRPGIEAVEAPSIVRRGGFYYLFASFDYCCRGLESSYRVVVGRSRELTGPYEDRDGVPMLEGGGTQVLAGYGSFVAAGHNDVLRDRGADWFVHHYYDGLEDGTARLSVRLLEWDAQGWPVLGHPVSDGGPGAAPPELVTANRFREDPSCAPFATVPAPEGFRLRWAPVGPGDWTLCRA